VALPVRRVDAPRRRPAGSSSPARGSARLASTPAPTRPDLRIVPRRRTAVGAAILLLGVVVALMLAAVVLHTRLTERQLEIDRLEQEVTEARERFDVLRSQRAELRAPARLAAESAGSGMIVAPNTEFVPVDGRTLAEVIAAAGTVDELANAVDQADPLDQFRRVKAATEGDD
jgi:cell division protein FtsL